MFDDATLPDSACVPCSRVHLHVDSDRDGTPDDTYITNNIWSVGPAGKGAILCVNCDNDDGKSDPDPLKNLDLSDPAINSRADLPEIAPFDIRKETNTPLSPATVILSLAPPTTGAPDYQQYIRIFDTRAAGGTEIIGPTTGTEKQFTDADFNSDGRIELGMEALQFPHTDLGSGRPTFDGYIELYLRVEIGGVVAHAETARLRVAPWMLFSHFDETEKVYVAAMSGGGINANTGYFIPALQGIVGSKLEIISSADAGGDRWVQDIMEVGYSSAPTAHDLPSVIRTPRQRLFGQYPGRRLLGADFGYYETNSPGAGGSLDSFGNLECSPPAGSAYPNGRLIYGTTGAGAGHINIVTEMREHLEAQGVQDSIKLDTGWLTVGHVDEFMSFIPDTSGTHGFKVAFACPDMALNIVQTVSRTTPDAPMFDGITADDGSATSIPPMGSNRGGFDEYNMARTVRYFLANSDLVSLQNRIQSVLNAQKATLKAGLGLSDSDFIDMPILFTASDKTQVLDCIALTPGSVNMLVVTKRGRQADLIIPKPFGPVVGAPGSTSEFQSAIDAAFASNSAVTLHYVDCFLTYHWMQGEIHCGTNSKRKPPSTKWWQ